jgi:hypothetical protein
MAEQWVEIFEHAARNTVVGDETKYPLPIMGSLKPAFKPTDQARKEFRGADTGQGDSTVNRIESQWTWTLECYAYPIRALGLLLKHAFGIAATRNVAETTAYAGILYPENLPFGSGQTLGDKALGFVINYDDGAGGNKARTYYGGRITKIDVNGEGSSEVKVSIEIQGPGSCIGAIGAVGSVPDFSTLPAPFNSSDTRLYIGAGIDRTGTAPEFTALDPGTMAAFLPDSFALSIETGRIDKTIMNGISGPSKTVKDSQLAVKLSCPIDLEDPSSGFSSRDEVDAIIADVAQNSVLIILDNGELAGDTAQNFQWIFDLANLFHMPVTEDFNTEGKTPAVTLELSGLYSDTTEYQIGLLTIDQESVY